MAHVTLIQPPFLRSQTRHGGALVAQVRLPSIGVAYLAAALRHANHQVDLIDAVGEGIGRSSPFRGLSELSSGSWSVLGLEVEEIVARIRPETNAVAISCMFSNEWVLHKRLIQAIREKHPKKLIFVGGEAVTADWDFILRSESAVDFCALGEGEETIVELADRLDSGQDWAALAGIARRLGPDQAVRNPRRNRLNRFSHLLPAWDLFPLSNYFRSGSGLTIVGGANLPILASRGCPYSCTFCSSPDMWGHSYIARDPEDIVEEMLHWKSIYPIDQFIFVDLSMTIKRDWTLRLARLIQEKRIGAWHMGSGTRTEIMTDEVIDALKSSGLVKMCFPVESGSKETLEKVQKRVNLKKMYRSMKHASSIGLPVKGWFIYGFPGQTVGQCLQSIFFAIKMAWAGVDEIAVHLFSPYPGSRLHAELVSQKLIPDKLLEPEKYELFLSQNTYDDLSARSWSEHLPPWLLKSLFWATYLLFLFFVFAFHPWKFWRLCRRVGANKPVTSIENRIVHLLGRSASRI